MYVFKLSNTNCNNFNFLAKKFKCCSYRQSDGTIVYKCKPRNKGINNCKKCFINNISNCCYLTDNYTLINTNIFYTPLIMSFTYTDSNRFPLDSFICLIPINNTENYLEYVYTLEPISPITNDNVKLTVHFKFTDNGITNDGLFFNANSIDFWNYSTQNLNITSFGNIPLSRSGSQFANLLNINFSDDINNKPSINKNTSLYNCFYNCSNFNSNINNWDISNVVDTSYMFYNCSNFNNNLNNWNTSKVTNMSNMFYNSENFSQNISNWNISNVYDTSYMFYGCKNFNNNLNNWDFSSIINIVYMFSSATNFNNGNTQSFNIILNNNLKSLDGMFKDCSNFNQNINSWNITNITSMVSLFSGASKFNSPLFSWYTKNVLNMSNLFYNATLFNQDISNWNTSKVTDMSFMFFNATSFNKNLTPLSGYNFNTSNVINISYMFNGASSFNNGQENNNTGVNKLNFNLNNKLTSLESMFNGATNFNQKISYDSINNYWNTSNITNMNNLFYNATNFANGYYSFNNIISNPTNIKMNWILNSELLRVNNTKSNDPEKPAPLNFSVGSKLTTNNNSYSTTISPFTGVNSIGNPDEYIPNVNYSNFGKDWNLIQACQYNNSNINTTKANWIDIATDLSGNRFIALATKNNTFYNYGIYISDNYGNNIYSITNYLDTNNNNQTLPENLRQCFISRNGIYQIIICNGSDSLNGIYPRYFYSNNSGNVWYEKIITNPPWNNMVIQSVTVNSDGKTILLGMSGFGASCWVAVSNNFGNDYTFISLSIQIFANINSVSINYNGKYQVALANQYGSFNHFIYYSNDYGVTWNNIFTITNENLGDFNIFKKTLSISDNGLNIYISFPTSFTHLYYSGGSWISERVSTYGIYNTVDYSGKYLLTTGNANNYYVNYNILSLNSGNYNLSTWNKSNTTFSQTLNGISTSYYAQFSYTINNSTTTNSNGQYINNGIYISSLPLIS